MPKLKADGFVYAISDIIICTTDVTSITFRELEA